MRRSRCLLGFVAILFLLAGLFPLFANGSVALADQGGLTGFVWIDTNNNRQVDAGEERVAGAGIQASPPGTRADEGFGTTTDSEGVYNLTLPEGTWTINANYFIQNERAWRQAITTVDVAAGQPTTLNIGLTSPGTAPTAVDAKIEILWPHDRDGTQQPVTEADLANIGVYLFQPGTKTPVPCDFDPKVRLWRALNNASDNREAELIATGTRQPISVDGKNFNRWLFNDIDVSSSRDPLSKVFLFVTVDGVQTYHNIWSHGADARTYFPTQDTPLAVAPDTTQVERAAARIEIVWPHDGAGNAATVTQATKANIAADIFQFGTLSSVPLDWSPTVRLYRALNNEVGRMVATGQKITVTKGAVTYPRWVFNNVDVSQATDPLNKYYFYITVDGVNTVSSIWSHGADARTYFPNPDVPTAGCQ